uniref:CDP-diacylglycerol--inositol 3-phosphatidyltransferase n=1 Tax=Ciona intestinalis TaxID=7719 RepID=F6V437_CIOIN|nr:CDP-diacylglycerol--inositol 3-phosphatidyltransferase [Ciona intestinalis]|eukprot:XP_002121442.1 CDP-diacylglycerol--inositol 3-phosphatidyltransferase [Ciona intestinalis]
MATTVKDIMLFIPNLIGYVRIVLAIASAYYMPFDYVTASLCYVISVGLDAIDGYAARVFNQGTKFGAMLDQLTDRASTATLVMTLSYFYPKYMFLFQMSLVIDIICHWLHLHVSIMKGSSHKSMGLDSNPIMKVYYTSRPVLFFMCAGNELFYSMLYLLYFTEGPIVLGVSLFRVCLFVSFPIMAVKTLISIIHLMDASIRLCAIDADDRNKSN